MVYSVNNQPPSPGWNKARSYGILGTVGTCLALFLFMWLYVMPYSHVEQPVEEEGLMVSFGNSDEGGGQGDDLRGTPDGQENTGEEKQVALAQPQAVAPAEAPRSVKQSSTANDDYVTQQEASLAIATKRKKEQENAARIAADNERRANDERVADQKRREQAAVSKASSAMNGLFGKGTSAGNGKGTGSGSGEGPGHQGNPAGKGFIGGHSWSLSGRTLTSMSQPSYEKDIEGRITVTIRVDPDGQVVSAEVGSPTTISDSQMRAAAKSAARKARFSAGSGYATGSITYNFSLK